uniref:L,D-transpeptidase n=1 Tax=Amycolatopsis kentuckyensis TaxID=218823 RepID=UPI00117836A5
MPNSVFFAPGGIAFHEGSLSRYSAGCVHLSNAASLKFFTALEKGDEVQVVR